MLTRAPAPARPAQDGHTRAAVKKGGARIWASGPSRAQVPGVQGKSLCGCTGLAAVLAVATCALAASTVLVPAARAVNVIPMTAGPPPRRRPRDTPDAMAGWQITLIAVGAAVAAAIAAVLLDPGTGCPPGPGMPRHDPPPIRPSGRAAR
jgi:hypothetical protein